MIGFIRGIVSFIQWSKTLHSQNNLPHTMFEARHTANHHRHTMYEALHTPDNPPHTLNNPLYTADFSDYSPGFLQKSKNKYYNSGIRSKFRVDVIRF